MLGLGDGIVVLLAAVGIVYGIYMLVTKKLPLYFQMSVCAVGCLMLGYVFDICDYAVNGIASDEYFIGWPDESLLTANIGKAEEIINTSASRKAIRFLVYLFIFFSI